MRLANDDLRLLDGLRLSPQKSFGGRVRGERLTRKRGVSIEFADFREYTEGDDLRHLDWNVLARLDVPVMRTYQDEEDLAVHLLLDCSPSMRFGEPSKIDLARQCALGLGYMALNGGDTVYAHIIGQRSSRPRAIRGHSGFGQLMQWVTGQRETTESLSQSLKVFANSPGRIGLVVLLSDGMDPNIASAIRVLSGRGHEVLFLQLLCRDEIEPEIEGDLRLVDGEGGETVELTVNGATLREYKVRFEAHNKALAESVLRNGGRFAQIESNWSIARVAQQIWIQQRWAQ